MAPPISTAHDTVQLDFITQWGSQLTGDGQLNASRGVAVDGSEKVYVGDPRNQRVQVFSGDGSFLRKWGSKGGGDG